MSSHVGRVSNEEIRGERREERGRTGRMVLSPTTHARPMSTAAPSRFAIPVDNASRGLDPAQCESDVSGEEWVDFACAGGGEEDLDEDEDVEM